ncbi:gamma-glutamylcyclotransferase family protein [Williamsia sterculiae]|uniref:Gamma-glutamyl cyclotransferase, AIG2-like n=1 Tax=Williamsia sterculiae TaxID=1344003 RepID=A0A1N7DK37_9NOCA|nr:gamma-glutamylcyclotransferase family protein [Williamsia sterculiae]SIR76223.1 Gamma-glutamyl cyclotransferase, AIG2-like [Williamsia sterculiae]
MHRLFSYGTLRDPAVQQGVFGRDVVTVDAALRGFRLGWVTITDPGVIAMSGTDRHRIVRPGDPSDVVDGAYLELTDDELRAADDYEVDDYVRVAAALASGERVWVYVAATDAAHAATTTADRE